tara:strand:- start:991 stop:1410 length:420 start_codon:yes stop_codon:yes gene_type:complete
MKNVLLFNNIPYNKIIKKTTSNEHPYKNIFINVFILLFFIIILGLFLSYRYKCKNNLNNDIIINNAEGDTKNDNTINDENDIIIEQNSNDIKEKKIVLDEKNNNNSQQHIINQKNLLLDIQNNNFGNNLDNEDEQYKLI